MAARDIVLIGVVIFALGIGFLIFHYISNTAFDVMLANPDLNSSATTVSVFQATKTTLNMMDYIITAVFIGLLLALMIGAWFISGYPIFMVLYMIVGAIGIVAGAIMSNIWEQVSQSSNFIATLGSFTITNHLLTYLPIYVTGAYIIGVIVMFAKPQEGLA